MKWQLERGWDQTVSNPGPHWGIQSHKCREGLTRLEAWRSTDTSSFHMDFNKSCVEHGGQEHRSRTEDMGEGTLECSR